MIPAPEVAAGDTARGDGLVTCADCVKNRETGVGRYYCTVFDMPVRVTVLRQCTAYLQEGAGKS